MNIERIADQLFVERFMVNYAGASCAVALHLALGCDPHGMDNPPSVIYAAVGSAQETVTCALEALDQSDVWSTIEPDGVMDKLLRSAFGRDRTQMPNGVGPGAREHARARLRRAAESLRDLESRVERMVDESKAAERRRQAIGLS